MELSVSRDSHQPRRKCNCPVNPFRGLTILWSVDPHVPVGDRNVEPVGWNAKAPGSGNGTMRSFVVGSYSSRGVVRVLVRRLRVRYFMVRVVVALDGGGVVPERCEGRCVVLDEKSHSFPSQLVLKAEVTVALPGCEFRCTHSKDQGRCPGGCRGSHRPRP